ncbi:unnamed protein product [Didymodactylos carnosus]|uniref:Glycosyltransferase n=1 Tax=Didymodactylos carnosus TaxID=1234261 RepID=A0A814ZFM0_9BILA|nr:unnamed protein product [Didymodactylos carnosus]CAF1306586.1 unnamed protein product [Didymodactylos carnosus]CAF4004105.1 unnamed protein product [Didymodactylos carnosus]CAF4113711.1 unnamed protein product [Didymodactylos carnosus]
MTFQYSIFAYPKPPTNQVMEENYSRFVILTTTNSYNDSISFTSNDNVNNINKIIYNIYIVFGFIYGLLLIDRLEHIFIQTFRRNNIHPLPSPSALFQLVEQKYPMVTIQLPMFNETAFCASAIDCACKLDWPKTSLFIHALDDSTDKKTTDLIDNRVNE